MDGLFDDLIPKQGASASSGLFDDLIPKAAAQPDPAPMPVPRPQNIGIPVPLPPTRPADLSAITSPPSNEAAKVIDDTGLNIPESENTLSAQLQQLVDGHRKAVMYPKGTEPLDLPDGFEVAHTPRGTFHYDPAQTTPEQIKRMSALGRENELLGLGPYNKDDVAARMAAGEPPVAVTERTPDGTEVRGAAGTTGTAPAQVSTMEAGKTPGNSVAVENPAGALSQRQYDPNDPDNGAAEPAPVRSKLGRIAGEALAKGIVKGATDTAKAASGQAFTKAPPENDDSEVGKLLKQDLAHGWKDPAWWTANMAHGIGSGAPMFAGAALGGVAGSAIGPEGTLPGAALGMGGMGMVQSLYPQYQAARQAGLSHDDAVKQAIDTSGILGVGAAVMGSAPAVSLFGKDAMGALKKPVGEALAQLFAVAPGTMVGQQAATNLREGRPVDEGLLQAGAMGVAQGIPIVAGHAVSRAARGPQAPAPSTVDQVSDFLRQADAAKPGQAPPEPLAPEDSHPSTDPTIQAGLRAAAAERARQEAERAPQRAAEEAAAAQAATARKAQETADSAAGSPESGGRSPETGPSPGGSGREPTTDDHLRAYGVPDEDISVMAPSEKQATLADLEQQGAPKGPVTAAEPEAEAPKAGTRAAPIKVETPEDVRAAEQHVDPAPTPAQIKAENYEHGHIDYEGLPVSIETAKGGTRRAPDGSWEVKDYPATYGRIKGTKATDGEAVDIFIGDKPPNGKVFVIHQRDPDTGAYDEPKAFAGVNSLGEAVRLYGKAYPEGAHLGRIGDFEEMTTDEFKQKLDAGHFAKPPEHLADPENTSENTSKPLETPTAAVEPSVGKAPKLPPKTPGKPQTLVAFLRKLGGIKDQGGELTARNAHRMHPGLVNNKRGMDLDQARRAAAEAGYLTPKNGVPPGMSLTDAAMADTTTNDLLAALDNHPHYAIGVERPSTDPRDDFDYVVDDIHKSLSDLGVRPELRDPELIAEAARIALAEGLDPDHAYESAIIRSLDNAERADIDQDGSIPWEIDGSPATGSPFESGEAADGAGGKDEGPGAQGKNPAGRPEHAGSGNDSQGAQEGQQHGTAPALTVEPGAEGKPQTVIPGAEQISAAEQGQRGADRPLKPTVPQKDIGGLFGDSMDQADLLDAANEKPASEPALRPSGATVIRYPSGRYGFVGKVPDELAFVEGSTPEQIKAGKQYGARFGAKTTVFDSAQEAVDYAKERGFSVNVVDAAEKPSMAAPTPTLTAYHGSKVDFDKFSSNHINTGEGSQAFSHGLYFAENPAVADHYRRKLAGQDGGFVYKVNIKAGPDQVLDFEKSLAEQDPKAAKRLTRALAELAKMYPDPEIRDGIEGVRGALRDGSINVGDALRAVTYDNIGEYGNASDFMVEGVKPEDLSKALRDEGIVATSFFDRKSRYGGEFNTRNLAVYDDAAISIAEKTGFKAAPTIDPVDAVPPDPPKPVPTDLQPGRTPADTIAQHFLEGGTFRTIVEARAFVREHAGQNLDNKQVEETIEHGIVLAAREIAKGPDQKANFDKLVDLYNRQPLLSTRTSTSVSEQAYSTPAPLAYVASRLAGIARAKNVFEPTAGNGMLLIEANPADAWANELNPERRAALAQQGFNVSGDDATVLSVPSASFDSVITNPPFGSVTDAKQSQVFEAGKLRTTAIDHAISLRALDAMRDDGKAVLIIGGVKPRDPAERGAAYQKSQQKRRFFYRLMEQYNVVDHFTVDGDLYKRQGASWPVDVIVIHGRRKSDRKPPSAEVPELLTTWDAVKGKLDDVAGAQETTATPRPLGEPAGAVDPASLATGAKPGNGGVRGKAGTSKPAERPPVAPESGDVGGGNDLGEPAGVRGEPSDAGVRTESEQPREPIRTDKRPDPDGGRQVDANEAGQVPYRQTSDRGTSLNTLAPANLATPMRESLRSVERRHGDVDHFVADSLGYKVEELGKYFSGEQIDALALGLDNIEKGSAIILGDQTGIGKGRVVAGMIRFAAKKGMTPVFVTEKPDLFGDMWRDLHDIGWDKHLGRPIEMMMTNANKRVPLDDDAVSWVAEAEQAKALGEPEPKRYGSFTAAQSIEAAKKKMDGVLAGTHKPDVVFTTYDQMNSTKGQENDRRNFLRAVAPRSFLIMDEAHNAGGAGDVENQARVDKDKAPPRSQVFREALANAKAVMYSSATFAKSPAVMDLYSRTDMSMAVDNPKMIPELVAKGGIPLQQMLSSTLAKSGQYVRRERSFEGVNYDMTTVPVDQESYAEFTKGLRQIFEFDRMFEPERDHLADHMAQEMGAGTANDGGVGNAAANSTNFASIMHNVVNQMVLSIKSKGAAEAAITALKGDQKPILALSTTMESFIKDYIADKGLKVGDPVPISFGDVMRRYLERTRRITLKMPDDTKQHVMIPLSDMTPGARAAYKQAEAGLKNLSFAELPLSPIDYMRHEITKAGYSVREVTGRSLMLDYSSNPPTLVDRPRSEEGSAGKRVSIQAFNAGKLDAIILNKSGSTGVSLHASSKFKDQRKREMILVQADANIDTHMQMLGRPHRTGQVQPPNYKHLVADIPAEARPTAITMKKMASLNANTTGARKSKFSGEAVDFMNDYGDRVVAEVLKEDPTLNGQLGYPVHISDDGKMLVKGAAAKATGRLTLLNPPEQQAFLDAVTQKYTALIAELDASGENKLEAKSIDLQARTLESATIKPSAGPSPFQAAVNLEKVSAKAQGRALAPSEVMGKIDEATGHKSDGTFGSLRLADRVGARKVGEAMAALRPAAEAYAKERASALTEPDAKQKAHASVMSGYEAVVEASRVAYPGAVVDLATRDGTMKAVVIGFSRAAKAKNPAAPSSWAVSFAVPDSSREVTVPVSRLTLSSDAPDEGFAVSPTGYTPEALTAQFEAARKEGREIRYVFTGNMLGAFDQTKGGGQIVNFTRENGEVHPGILMSRGFNASKFMAGRSVRFKDGKQVLAFLGKVPDGEIKSSDDIITIRKVPSAYEFEMPAAKAKGGVYYTDRSVRAVYDGWVKKGSVMRADVNATRAEALINALQKVDAVFETRAHQELAEEIVRPTPEESSTGTSAARRAPPPVSFDIPPDVRTRGPAEVRRFRQLVAVATHMIDGMLPEGHGVEYRAVDTIRTSGDVLAASGGDPTDKALGLFSAQTVHRIHRDAEGNIVHRDQIVKLLIETTRDDKTPIQSLAHEIAHAMQYLRLYTPVEFRALQRERPELERIAAAGNNLNIETATFDELVANAQGEYIGHAFGEANPGQTAPPMPGIIVRTARRIMAIWRRLRNLFAENNLLNKEGWKGLFKGRGYTTAEDIFKAAARGDFADRKMGEGQSWSTVKSESARPRPKKVGEGTKWEERRTAIVEAIADRMIRLKQAEEQVAGAFPAYRTESLSYGRINERIDDIVHHTLDPVSKDLRQNGIGPDDFGQYLYARHAERRNEIIRVRRRQDPAYDEGSGMSDADAQQILADVAASGQQAIYDRNAQRIYDLLDESLDTRVASGTMSQQQADDLRAEFGPDYVPLKGDAGVDPDDYSAAGGKRYSVKGRDFQQSTGRQSEAADPFTNSIFQAIEGVMRTETNRVAKAIRMLALTDLNSAAPTGMFKILQGAPLRPVLDRNGLVRMVQDRQFRDNPNVIVAKIGGLEKYVEIQNDNLAKAVKDTYLRSPDSALRFLQSATSIYSRLRTTLNPFFSAKNFIRDNQDAVIAATIHLQGGAAKFAKHLPGAMEASRAYVMHGTETPEFNQFRLSGGRVTYAKVRSLDQIQRRIQRMIAGSKANPMNIVRHLVDGLQAWSEIPETAVRYALYKAAREAGKNVDEAASLALEGTLNFYRRGNNDLVKYVTATNPFLNANIQSPLRATRMATKNWKGYVAYLAALPILGASLAVWNYLIGGKDNDGTPFADKIPVWEHERNWVIYTGAKDAQGRPIAAKVPSFPEFTMLAGFGRAQVAMVAGGVPLSEILGNQMKQVGSVIPGVGPGIFQGAWGIYANKDFKGSAVHPDPYFGQKNVPSSEIMWPGTAKGWQAAARVIARVGGGDQTHKPAVSALDLHPEDVKYLVKEASGSLYPIVAWLAGKAAQEDGGKTPLLGDFVMPGWEHSNYDKQKFTDAEGEANAEKLASGKKGKGSTTPRQGVIAAAKRDMKADYKELDRVRENKQLSPDVKQARIEAIQYRINERRKQAQKALERVH